MLDIQIAQNTRKKIYGGGDYTGIYCRLSRDDGEDGTSNSIINQKMMLEKYAIDNDLGQTKIYIDDGFSGTNFNRPDFQRMIKDVEKGELSTIIVKDMSRFGRDYIMVGYYTEIYFKNNDVRFIAINDGVDTDAKEENDFAPFKNIMNEWYAKDTSKKTKAVFRAKSNSGKHISSRPPYGYKLDPNDKHKWIIDEIPANNVRRMFSLYISGVSMLHIANIFNEEEIESPIAYYRRVGLQNKVRPNSTELWNRTSIKHMLDCHSYVGDTVNFTTYKKSYKSKRNYLAPKENWVIFKDTQEPIIDRDTFAVVQKMRETKRGYTYFDEVNIFAGLLYCVDCGAKMTIHRNSRNRNHDAFVCSTYRKNKGVCTYHRIPRKSLEIVVLDDIKKVCDYVMLHENDFVENYKKELSKISTNAKNRARKELEACNNRYTEINKIIRKLYEDTVKGVLTDERFVLLSKTYDDEQQKLKEKIHNLTIVINEVVEEDKNIRQFTRLVERYTNIQELSIELLNSLIDRIEVGEKEIINNMVTREVKIKYKFLGAITVPNH